MSGLWIRDETDAQDQSRALDPEGLLDQQDEVDEDGEGGDTSHISEKMCEQALASTTDASGSEEETGESADSEGMDTDPDSASTPTVQPTGKAIFSSGYDSQPATASGGPERGGANNTAAGAATAVSSAITNPAAASDNASGEAPMPSSSSSAGHEAASGTIPGTPGCIKEIKERFKVPSMIPRPTAIPGSKKKTEEPDIIPTDTYRKIRENLKQANVLPTIGGSGSGSVADESVGSFYNKGDNIQKFQLR